jgi:hypothetical protein
VIGTTERGAAVRDGEITPRLHELQGVLSVVMPTYLTENIWGYLWGKLVYGTMSFVISCVDAPAPEVLANPLARRVARAASSETARIVKLVQEIERGERGMGWDNLDVLAAQIPAEESGI